MTRMVTKKRTRKLPPLPKTIEIMGGTYLSEALLDSMVEHDMPIKDMARVFNRSVPSIEQALNGRTKEFIELRNKVIVNHQITALAAAGNSKMLTLIAENKLGFSKDAMSGLIPLPQPLIINFPKE